jgi:hypothetical protein
LTAVEGEKEEWRRIVCAAEEGVGFAQANPSLSHDGKGKVEVREYGESCEGVVRSWAERAV